MSENKTKLPLMLDWIEGNIPVSKRFDDPYYSKAGGLAETGHVFVDGNQLPDRWSGLKDCKIGELGFGTGLNFIATINAWEKYKRPGSKLKFVSFEQFPMLPAEMMKALSRWPELDMPARKLTQFWGDALNSCTGKILINWSDDISLRVHIGDANEILPTLNLAVDAWYLDGFSPAKNPQLWTNTLLQSVYQQTAVNGTFATYTAAGWVRRNLQEAGFEVERIAGYAGKRQMSIGKKQQG